MLASQTPTLIPLAFAANGTKNVIPEASQIGVTPGAASLNDGFPPLTFTPIAAGGVPPAGGDFNGVLNLITQSIRWAHGGGGYAWNSAFTTDANVAGYPNGAELNRADLTGFWINTVDGNETNPDAVDGTAAGWVPGYNYGTYAVTGLTNANVTLFPLQAAKSRITLAGALTGNIQLIFPTWLKEWEVVNNTTGAFTITAKTAAGTGVALAAGQQKVTGDGTNITQPAESIAPATLPTHPVQFSQVSGVVGQVRNLFMQTTAASATATLQSDEIIVESALGGLRYCLASFNKTINLATTGAGGMDTGAAPASGFVAIYAIFNPTTGVSALLATNATATAAQNVYSGANMPAGYTASALVSVWPTTSAGLLNIAAQRDRRVVFPVAGVLNTTTPTTTVTAISISSAVPKNALEIDVYLGVTQFVSGNGIALNLGSTSNLIDLLTCSAGASSGTLNSVNIKARMMIVSAQTIFYQMQNTSSGSYAIAITGYLF